MYLTKNSRYVLQKARCVSPSFCFLEYFKGNKTNYSVKPPKDDPTKPPLRINIPNDPGKINENQSNNTNVDQPKVHKREISQTKSKNLLSKSTDKENFIQAYEEGINNVSKNDSNVHREIHSEFHNVDNQSAQQNISTNTAHEIKPETTAEKITSQKIKNLENVVTTSNEKIVKDSSQKSTILKNKESVQNSIQDSPDSSKIEISKTQQNLEEENSDQKALYIIIDVPGGQANEELTSSKSSNQAETNPRSAYLKVDYHAMKAASDESLPSKIPKLEWYTNTNPLNKVLEKRSQSLPSHSNKAADAKPETKINLQVHEIDEAATYVFHLKFKKNFRGKSFAVGCVPEKELNLRTEGMAEGNEQVKGINSPYSMSRSYKGFHKEMPAVEDRTEPVKHESLVHQNKVTKNDSFEHLKRSYKSSKSTSSSPVYAIHPKTKVDTKIDNKKEASKVNEQHSEEIDIKTDVKTGAEEPVVTDHVTDVTNLKVDKKSLKNVSAKHKAQERIPEIKSVQNLASEDSPEPVTEKWTIATNEKAAEPVADIKEAKVEDAQKEVSNSELDTSQYSSKPDEKSTSFDNKAYEQYLQQYYSEYYKQQASSNVDRQESYDPDAKEYYYYKVDHNTPQHEASSGDVTSIDHPSESAQKISKNVNFQKSSVRKRKSEKSNKNDPKKGKGAKFSNFTTDSYKCSSKREPREPVNFHTSANVVKISSDSSPNSMKFCAAYPPHVNEYLIGRSRKVRMSNKNRFFNVENSKLNFNRKGFGPVSSQKENVEGLSDASILFSKSQKKNFNCEALLRGKKNETLPDLNADEKSPKISDNMVNMVNETLNEEKGEPSLDTLTMMKKVKEIVNFDLNNAVKLFEGREAESIDEVTSVVINKGNVWEVDVTTLEKCINQRRAILMKNLEKELNSFDIGKKQMEGDSFKKIDQNSGVPKFLPGRKQNEKPMKLSEDALNSVVVYNPGLGLFQIDDLGLDEAVQKNADNVEYFNHESDASRTTIFAYKTEPIVEVPLDTSDDLSGILMTTMEMKGGDSILVFDELTQTWKVDYTILEKREEQIRQEKELTKRSELILETIEKLEKGNISNIPKPDTREKKTFDYTSEEWKTYKSDERPVDPNKKFIKEKHPFKETDAEEIRKKNSDLYENLFVVNKKDGGMSEEGKKAPGSNSSDTKKEAITSKKVILAKDSKQTSTPSSGTEITSKDSNKSQKNEKETAKIPKKEEMGFWENFLNTNILPFDRPLQPPKPAPQRPPPPPATEKQAPKVKVPPPSQQPKIEDKRFRIPYPFGWDKNIDSTKVKTPVNKENQKPIPSSKTIPTPKKEPTPIQENPKKPILPTAKDVPGTKPLSNPPPSPPKISPSTGSSSSKPVDSQKAPEVKQQQKKTPFEKLKINFPLPSKPQTPTPPVAPEPPKPSSSPSSPLPKSKEIKQPSSQSPPVGPDQTKTSGGLPPPTSPPEAPNKRTSSPDRTKTSKILPPEKRIDPGQKSPPTIGSPMGDNPGVKALKDSNNNKNDLKTKGVPSVGEKKEKAPSEHYISDNILEMSKSSAKDLNSKTKPNKIETVRVNIVPDKRVPSKVTEINLNKKCEETTKDISKKPKVGEKSKSSDELLKIKKSSSDSKFYKNFEKYKTPFSDPDYEEKSMKINSNIESNPNLKKLDNWNKTLVLHDVVKPPENIETWLKDETDKMATLLLKVLQEAAEGKPRKKPMSFKGKSSDRTSSKGNPYDTIRKKQENSPESFLFKVNAVNVALEADRKMKSDEMLKRGKPKSEQSNDKDIPVQSAKTLKPTRTVDAMKVPNEKDAILSQQSTVSKSPSQCNIVITDSKNKLTELTLESIGANVSSGDVSHFKVVADLTDDIPGPEILKKISSAWKLFPVLGCQLTIFVLFKLYQLATIGSSIFPTARSDKSLKREFSNLFAKYGPIVNLQGPLSGNVVLIHKPEHLSAVFEQDALSPTRSIFDSLEQSRREIDDKFFQTGIVTDWSKPKWNALKKDFSDPIAKSCENFLESVEHAGDSLINTIRRNRNNQNLVSQDFMAEIKRWSLEGLCSVLLARSFGFLENKNQSSNWLLEPDKLFIAVENATESLSKCERGFQIWRLMATSSLLNLGQAYRTLSIILSKQLYQAELSLKNKHEQIKDGIMSVNAMGLTYLESMLLFDGMTPEEITCNLVDILIMGTNIMSSSLGFLLYHLAQDVRVQNNLVRELKTILPDKTTKLDYQKLNSSKYLQACLKESLRLNSPLPFFFRLLQNDILLSNYVVPKGTYVVMDSRVSSTKEQIFEEPEKFIPERWLNEDKWMLNCHPFSSFPLCQGPRSDLAKQIVEMQLCSCAAKIIRNFQIEYHFGEISGTESVISFPDKPLKFNFIERKD